MRTKSLLRNTDKVLMIYNKTINILSILKENFHLLLSLLYLWIMYLWLQVSFSQNCFFWGVIFKFVFFVFFVLVQMTLIISASLTNEIKSKTKRIAKFLPYRVFVVLKQILYLVKTKLSTRQRSHLVAIL